MSPQIHEEQFLFMKGGKIRMVREIVVLCTYKLYGIFEISLNNILIDKNYN